MSLLKKCQEFDDMANKYVIALGGGKFYMRRFKGGYIVHTTDLDKAHKFDSREEALRQIDILQRWKKEMHDRAKQLGLPGSKELYMAAIPFSQAKDIRFG